MDRSHVNVAIALVCLIGLLAGLVGSWRRSAKVSAGGELALAPESREALAQAAEAATNGRNPDRMTTADPRASASPHADQPIASGDEPVTQDPNTHVARDIRELIQGTSDGRNTKEGFSFTESPFSIRTSLVEPVLARGRTALPFVQAILEDPKSDSVTVYHATYILARLGGNQSAECLRGFLKRELDAARSGKYFLAAEPVMGAIRALSEIGHDPDDIEVVRGYLACDVPAILLEAGEALLSWGDDSSDVLEALAYAEELGTWGAHDGSTRVQTLCDYFLAERFQTTPRSWQTWKRRHLKNYKSGSFKLMKRTYRW